MTVNLYRDFVFHYGIVFPHGTSVEQADAYMRRLNAEGKKLMEEMFPEGPAAHGHGIEEKAAKPMTVPLAKQPDDSSPDGRWA